MKTNEIPLSVPKQKKAEFKKNINLLTANTGNLFLIAGDQKLEHLNSDFYGPGIASEDAYPEHLFNITKNSSGGVLASHLGIISQYGNKYPDLTYIVKINGKSNLGDNEAKDSSVPLWSVADVLKFKKESSLKIAAIGYTLYLGSKYESKMLQEAAKAIFEAHQAGLATVLWMYPRGKGINEENIHTIAGGAGVAACLDADFVKIKYPYKAKDKKKAALDFKEAVVAAGKTKIICVGGAKQSAKSLLSFLNSQLKVSGTAGLAIGRNLHQRAPEEAYRLAKAISALILDGVTLAQATKIYEKKTKLNKAKKTKKPVKSRNKILGFF